MHKNLVHFDEGVRRTTKIIEDGRVRKWKNIITVNITLKTIFFQTKTVPATKINLWIFR